MRLKTFIATYLLFLAVLFSSIGMVSFNLNNSQMNMLKEKSTAQFHTIASSLYRDIAVLWGHSAGRAPYEFYNAVDGLLRGYARYYNRHYIDINVQNIGSSRMTAFVPYLILEQQNANYAIFIQGLLQEPFGNFLLSYRRDITESVLDMRRTQNILLMSMIIFSILAAAGLYVILSMIFKPLNIIAKTSQKIASGNLSERIPITANNELAQVAKDFNSMAERMEQQITLLAEDAENKQQFVDNFAHEMRTPLTSIYGYAEYMQKAVLEDGEMIDISERIMQRAGYLQSIANSLLELAMLKDYTPNIQTISLAKLFEDVRQILDEPMSEGGVLLEIHVGAETVLGQEDLIKSLLLNLCLNALKACIPNIASEQQKDFHESTYDGKPMKEQKIIALMAMQDGKNIHISVTDNGCGIPAEALSKVTEPFYRVDKARNRRDGGAGLGLTLCQRIADAHGAKMYIESAIRQGTTVHITFTTP